MLLRYYTAEDLLAIEVAQDFHELTQVALRVLERKPAPAVMVCGPITTGGFGPVLNRVVFQMAIEYLMEEEEKTAGRPVFNQWPLESGIERLVGVRPEYCRDILDVLYTRVFQSGQIRGGLFLPNWTSSTGANWEREFLQERGLSIEPYPAHLYQKILDELKL